MKIAWIGTGVMGSSMLLHLNSNSYDVNVYNRTISKAKPLAEKGVVVCESIRECVKDCDVIFTIVGYPSDVEEVYLKEDGIFQNAKANAICVDMTTSSPNVAQKLYKEAQKWQIRMLDAPVSGGDSGARNATLSIMVGGDEDAFKAVYPLLEIMGKTISYMGEAGCGQHTKACNQIGVAGAVAAMSEAIHYARINGLDESKMLAAISQGAGGSWQLTNTAPRVLKEDFEPGFYIKHFIKDMHIIQDEMHKYAQHLEVLDTVCKMYEDLAEAGLENDGTQALVKYYKK